MDRKSVLVVRPFLWIDYTCAKLRPRINASGEQFVDSIRIHVAGDAVWALCKCGRCGEVQKFTLASAIATPVPCKRCGNHMDIKGAVVEAVDRMPDWPPRDAKASRRRTYLAVH